jgi:UDP-GlcNAc:undecaprenyl-phosphate GlcNAc-1-phosphate transferase
VASTTFFFIARDLGQLDAAALAVALAGCSLGFLWLNLPPARVYMGDSGSNLLGFGLASVPLLLSRGGEGFGNFSVTILLLAVPIADTATTILRRLMLRRSPLLGDHGHVHHRLLRQGWSQGAVIAFLGGLTLAIALLVGFGHSIAMASGDRTLAAWLAMLSLVVLSSIYMLSGRPDVRPPSIEDKPEI